MAHALHAELNRDMVAEANAFLDTLDLTRSRSCVLPFDAAERFQWSYFPGERPGLMLRQMDRDQRKAALRLLRAALSETGFAAALGIMALEEVLRDQTGDGQEYDPLNYAIAIFGNPTAGPPWAWRVDGHHLSATFTVGIDGTVAATPHFMGANPAAFDPGHRVHSVLGDEEEMGRAVMRSLDDGQRAKALIAAEAPHDIVTGPGREESLRRPAGLPLVLLGDPHRHAVLDLLRLYANRLRPELASSEMARIREAGVDRLHFAWAGGLEPGQPHYYRISGPSVVVEYDNSRDGANHIHTVWHDPGLDFGRDLLAEHAGREH